MTNKITIHHRSQHDYMDEHGDLHRTFWVSGETEEEARAIVRKHHNFDACGAKITCARELVLASFRWCVYTVEPVPSSAQECEQ